jgi:hypothetical protein
MIFERLRARAVPGGASGLLALGSMVLLGVPLGPSRVLAHGLAGRPVAQCVTATEAEVWRGRYGAGHVAVDHQYYCGPAYPYNVEWDAAHVGPHPAWYAVSDAEPTTCATYHFVYENRWFCYAGP